MTTTRLALTLDDAAVAERHRSWVFGWERHEDDAPFGFDRTFGDYYDHSFEAVILYDDFDPQHRVARHPSEYGAIWEPGFNGLRSAHHLVVDGPHVVSSGELAASTLVFVARLESLEGRVTGIHTTTSLVWRATESGWKIIREHNSSVVLPAGQAESILAAGVQGG